MNFAQQLVIRTPRPRRPRILMRRLGYAFVV